MEREHLEVTDDVSIVEHLKHLVFITEGSYTNLKVRKLPSSFMVLNIESSSFTLFWVFLK